MPVRLTVENDYGFRLVEYLLNADRVVPASELSEALEIPLRFTLKILRKLNLAGLTIAKRGANGGYMMARPGGPVSLYEVIEATQGPIILNRCIEDPENCNMKRTSTCDVHEQLLEIQKNLVRDLKAAKIERK